MKKTLLILCGCGLVFASVYAASTQTKNTGAGLQIGTASTQKLAFYGGTPTNQLTVTVSTNTLDTTAATLKQVIDALRLVGLVNTN